MLVPSIMGDTENHRDPTLGSRTEHKHVQKSQKLDGDNEMTKKAPLG